MINILKAIVNGLYLIGLFIGIIIVLMVSSYLLTFVFSLNTREIFIRLSTITGVLLFLYSLGKTNEN